MSVAADASAGDPAVLWVDDLSDRSVPRAGSKIARLGELRRCGVAVPDGFVVTTRVYEEFLQATGAGAEIDAALAAVPPGDDGAIAHAAARARAAVEGRALPDALAEVLTEAYEELSFRRRDLNIPVAVRSSATGEDGTDASFAGQFDTYLGVTGASRLLEKVRACWGSLFTERAVGYRLRNDLDHRQSPMAVGVLELVHARTSGVAFSIHPVTGNAHRMVIEGSWGWGEAVVQGLVTPDHIEVGKSDRRVLAYEVAEKKVCSAFDYSQGLVVEREMPRRLRCERILEEEEIQAVVSAVLSIEERYGYPVDVEWVLDRHRRPGDPVTIVQTRPVTVTPEEEATPRWDPVAYAAKYAFGGRGGGGVGGR
ncbi:MAG: PEP/pyruvate-binding domain-containing protein [Sandaracinaceae bacterium]